METTLTPLQILAQEISLRLHIGIKCVDEKDEDNDEVIGLDNDIEIHFSNDKVFVNEWYGDNYKTIYTFPNKEELLKCIHVIKDR